MKHALTLLLALAASAHAQFAVMHTNGVVTSPTNFTIQQSNVSGLSNALAGKLDTNGSAAGLTGFVGTTNAETARGNLGISNTFAGQFHADFYDDFSRYSNGTSVGSDFVPYKGSPYFLRLASTNYTNAPIVTNGKLVSTNGEVFYLTSELSRPVYNFGAVFEFEQLGGGNVFTILIQPDDTWIGRVLHVSVSPITIAVDVSTNGTAGFGGSNTIIYEIIPAVQKNTKQVLLGQIDGDTLYINYAGRNYSAKHPQMTNVVGNYFSFESFYTSTGETNRIHSVWANSPALQKIWSASDSEPVAQLSSGFGRIENNLIVGSDLATLVGEIGTNKALVGGDVTIKGAVRGRVGGSSQIGVAPMVHQRNGGAANTNTTNLTGLVSFNIIANTLAQDWSRWSGTYVGSFANNTNDKRVTINMGGGARLDTGLLAESGEWKVDVLVYRSATNSHEGFAMFQSEQTTKTSRWTFNNGAAVQFNIGLEAAGDANNDVILRGAWSDVFP